MNEEILEIVKEIDKNFGKVTSNEFTELLLTVNSQKIVEKVSNKVFVIGDVHGDYDSLVALLKKVNYEDQIIFLGDYGDRGNYQVDVYYLVLKLKAELKDRVVLLRGNHEYYKNFMVSPHDLPRQLLSRFGNKAIEIYNEMKKFWNKLAFAAFNDNFFFVHGGIPIEKIKIEEIEKAGDYILVQLLWNDPLEGKGYEPSYRGIGFLFGQDITEDFLSNNKKIGIIRSHEACNGVKYNHNKKVITIFSMKGYYGNTKAAALSINKTEIKEIFV